MRRAAALPRTVLLSPTCRLRCGGGKGAPVPPGPNSFFGGEITANGIALTDLPVEVWREYVALVPQRPYLFYGSVSANIRLARPDASDDEVVQAAEFAGAAEFINGLPQGYATEIGERGTRLSA